MWIHALLFGEGECGCHAHFAQRQVGETSSFPKPSVSMIMVSTGILLGGLSCFLF